MGGRRRSRELALQILCSLDRITSAERRSDADAEQEPSTEQGIALFEGNLLAAAAESSSEPDDAPDAVAAPEDPDPGERKRRDNDEAEVLRFAETLARGVRDHLGEIDQLVSQCSRNWRMERMAWVDRNLLRLASHELRAISSTPARVVLNEAIELAKRFGTAESPSFINGVLDRVMESLGRRA